MIKKMLKEIFFKEDFETLENSFYEEIQKRKNVEWELEKIIKMNEKFISIINSINCENEKIIGIELNNNREIVMVVISEYPWLAIKLRGIEYQWSAPRIMCTYKDKIENSYIHIDDFFAIREDVGNGSILLKYLIEFAKEKNVKYISGMLSSVDKDHFDKLEHFYEKFGFKVSFNQENENGRIRLDI